MVRASVLVVALPVGLTVLAVADAAAAFELQLRPAAERTWVLVMLAGFASPALIWLFWSLRLQRARNRFQNRLAELEGERVRTAYELHDTLLHDVQGLTLRFQSVADQIPPEQPVRQVMEEALERADEIITKGRDRIRALRTGE
jgi:signal transduction histidine kinase